MATETLILSVKDETHESFVSVQRSIEDVQKASEDLNTSLSKMFEPQLLLDGISSFIDATQQALDFADNLGQLAQQTGFNTEALQELDYAGLKSGASIEAVNGSLAHFSQVIGDAAAGSDDAIRALGRVGITVDDIRAKSIDTLFSQATDSISGMGSAAERNSALVQVFGDSARQASTFLSQSAGNMAQLRAEAASFGAVLSEETIAKASEAKGQLAALSKVLQVQMTQALVDVGPLLVKGAGFLADFAKMATWAARSVGLIDQTSDSAYDALLAKRAQIADRIDFLQKAVIPGTIGGTMRAELEDLKKELADVDKEVLTRINKWRAEQDTSKGKPAAPGAGSAAAGARKAEQAGKAQAEKAQAAQWDQAALGADQSTAAGVNALKDSLMSPEDKLTSRYMDEQLLLEDALNNKLITEQSYYEISQQSRDQYQNQMKQMQDSHLSEEQRLWQSGFEGKLQVTSSILGNLSSLMASHNKKQFEIGKAAAISQALIDTYLGAQKAYTALIGIPIVGPGLAVAAAAAAVAAGMMRVNQIRSQSFNAGGSASSAGAGGGSGPSAGAGGGIQSGVVPDMSQSQPKPQSAVQVYIQGNLMTNDFVEQQIIPSIQSAVNGRDVVLFQSNSRQALELTQ